LILLGEHLMNTDERKEQSTPSRPTEQEKSGPPQFLIDATVAVNAGEVDKAIDILKQAIPQDGFTACNAIGQIYLSIGGNEKALEWLQKAREYRPDSTMVIAGIGQALAGVGRRDEVVEELTKAMKVQPKIKASQTIELLQQIVEKNPSRMDAVFELAKALEKSGRLDEAEEWYKKILEREPHVRVYEKLTDMCRKMGRLSEAKRYLEKIIEMEPDNP
jgi:tetratricopeptide (TPR) repeat protein